MAAAGDDVRARVTLIAGNALEQDLSSATAFFLFLVERGLKIMLPLLQEIGEARVKAGAAKLPVACYLYRCVGARASFTSSVAYAYSNMLTLLSPFSVRRGRDANVERVQHSGGEADHDPVGHLDG